MQGRWGEGAGRGRKGQEGEGGRGWWVRPHDAHFFLLHTEFRAVAVGSTSTAMAGPIIIMDERINYSPLYIGELNHTCHTCTILISVMNTRHDPMRINTCTRDRARGAWLIQLHSGCILTFCLQFCMV